MKKISILGVSFLSMIALATVLFFNSCTDDPCKDNLCSGNGTCVSGTCACDNGYEGTDCSTESRAKFIGTYLLSGTDNNGFTYTNISTTISISQTDVNKIVISVAGAFSFPATLTGSTSFAIDATFLSGFNYTGNGSINGTTLTITINEADATSTTIYNWTGIKQ